MFALMELSDPDQGLAGLRGCGAFGSGAQGKRVRFPVAVLEFCYLEP